jgi:predicted metal-dependent phosphoesterase TrpH
MTVAKILQTARIKGLSGIAVSDHNTLDGSIEALERAPEDLLIIPAAEYSTDRGHMLAYFIAQDASKAGLNRSPAGLFNFEELEAFVHESGGLLFAAHPFRQPYARLDGISKKLDGIEIFNSRNVFHDIRANDSAVNLCLKEGLAFCAGSDAHAPDELGNAYRIFNADRTPDLSELKGMLSARRGSCFGRVSPLSAQGKSALYKHARKRDLRGIAKGLLKTGFGVLYDAAFKLDAKNERDVQGQTYHMNVLKEGSE